MALPAATLVIFGATGDLTRRKLIPALCTLHPQLHAQTRIFALGRRDYTDEQMREELKVQSTHWPEFSKRITYHRLEFDDRSAYEELSRRLPAGNRVFYLATPPESFHTIIAHLSESKLASSDPKGAWHRVVFEKPFGNDTASARKLNKDVTSLFDERQIYRIDHYLGKEIVQNILVVRFSNPIFERLWESAHIDNVQILVSEAQGVGTRGGYYDTAGALRDMVQNHMLQLLALTAMESPATLDPDDIRGEKVKALRAIALPPPAELRKRLVLGQYTAGTIAGQTARAYLDEEGVGAKSKTETFAAVELELRNKRWLGVPFYLKTGKALPAGFAEIVVTFKQTPCLLFCGPEGELAPNKLVLRIQPDEGLQVQFNLKEHGADYAALPHTMDFSHAAEFGTNTPEAYERLLADVLRGDQTLFTRWDEVEQAWRVVDALRAAKTRLHEYPAGSDGPAAAAKLIERDRRKWHR